MLPFHTQEYGNQRKKIDGEHHRRGLKEFGKAPLKGSWGVPGRLGIYIGPDSPYATIRTCMMMLIKLTRILMGSNGSISPAGAQRESP
jgi:hypothetical protein